MRTVTCKVWIGRAMGAALILPVTAVMGAATTTPPTGAAASQPTAPQTDAQVIREQLPNYPLDTCVISGGKLGEMGEACNYVYKGRLVRFCCPKCKAAFNKDPAKYLAMIDKAAATRPAKVDNGIGGIGDITRICRRHS